MALVSREERVRRKDSTVSFSFVSESERRAWSRTSAWGLILRRGCVCQSTRCS